jgi:hypothetical protein
MRRALRVTVALASMALAVRGASSAAPERAHVKVPEQIVAELKAEGFELEFDAAGKVDNLAAEPIDLNGDGEPELEVHGMGSPTCGAANCVTWLYRKAGRGYQLLLYAGSINRIEPQKSSIKGYRDIMTVMHGSAFESGLKLYKFDGRRYRRKGCFFRTYQDQDAQGNVRELKKPKITRTRCEEEE